MDTAFSRGAALRPVGVGEVVLGQGFWCERVETAARAGLPAQWNQCRESGRLHNLRRAAGLEAGEYIGEFYGDSDLYKWMEAAAWSMLTTPAHAMRAELDEAVGIVAAAQDADGYLNSYFTGSRAAGRFADLAVMHELYCIGHLIQAAVAHWRATGSRALLDVAVRAADHVDTLFGPGKRPGACGHPEIEMALVELFRTTGTARYLDLAGWFIEQRGQRPPVISGRPYHQDHLPLREQREAVGHAVRALYLYCGGADVDLEGTAPRYQHALSALWQDVTERKSYVTGGLGARWEEEAFGDRYELPSARAYAETCAAIAMVMWAWRMFLASGDPRLADTIETTMINAVLPGMSESGDRYFYQNPLADGGRHRRVPWFATACCPPNIARTLLSWPGYLYAQDATAVYVAQYASCTADFQHEKGRVRIVQTTGYPADGTITLAIETAPDQAFMLRLRRPGWARRAAVRVNGTPVAADGEGWLDIHRTWRPGDVVTLTVDIEPRTVLANPRVSELTGQQALFRGPVLYCVESADNPGIDLDDLRLPGGAAWAATDRVTGLVPLTASARLHAPVHPGQLYAATYPANARGVDVVAVPYHRWGNRAAGQMRVWSRSLPGGPARSAG